MVDTTELQLEAWEETAEEHGFRKPDREEVQRAMLMKPELAVRDEFYWTLDIFESREVALTHHDKLQECFDDLMNQINATKLVTPRDESKSYFRDGTNKESCYYLTDHINATAVSHLFPVVEGARNWLENLREVEMPCAVISHLDTTKLDTLLNITGLSDFFAPDQRVSCCAGYDREGQEYLGAALRIKRRPDHCVVFDATPSSSIAAHEVEIKAVSLMGMYAMYELNTADLTIDSFDYLTTVNVRRLFSDKSFEPEVELELERPLAKPKRVRTWVEGDRN